MSAYCTLCMKKKKIENFYSYKSKSGKFTVKYKCKDCLKKMRDNKRVEVIRICKECNSEFSSLNTKSINYCNIKCYRKTYRKSRINNDRQTNNR